MSETEKKLQLESMEEKPEPKKDTSGHFTLQVFSSTIVKVEKVLGISALERPVWKIYMEVGPKKRVIAIENKKLAIGPVDFNLAVFGAFNIRIPTELLKKPEKGAPDKWLMFTTQLGQIAEEIQPESRTEWLETDILLEALAGQDITDDREEWDDTARGGNALFRKEYKGEVYLCIKSKELSALAKTLKLGSTLENFSEVMDARGIKRPTNPTLALQGGRKTRAWWIKAEELKGKMPLLCTGGNGQAVTTNEGY